MQTHSSMMFRMAMAMALVVAVSMPIAADGPEPASPRSAEMGASTSSAEHSSSKSRPSWVPDSSAIRIETPSITEFVVVNMKDVSSAPPDGKVGHPKAHIQGEVFQYQPDIGDGTAFRAPDRGPLPDPVPFPVEGRTEKSGRAVGDIVVSFDGLANTGWIPPDTILAVGPDHIVEATNSGFAVYSRFGTEMQAYTTFTSMVNLPTPWAGSLFDPRVIYSTHYNKWVMLILGKDVTNQGSYHWFLISDTTDPTGTWRVGRSGASGVAVWLDYASLGVDEWGVYVTGNQFDWVGDFDSSVLITRDPAMMSGGGSGGYVFTDLRWPNNDYAVSLQFAHPHWSSSTQTTYAVNTYEWSGNQICLWEINGDRAPGGSTPAYLSKSAITLGYTYDALGEVVGQPDVSDDIDGLTCRVMNAVYALDRVYATFATDVNADGRKGGAISVRLEVTAPTLEWNSLLHDGREDFYYFFPAITVLGAASTNPNVGIGFSASGEPTYASFGAYIYNQAGTNPILNLAAGMASYVARDTGGVNRWGDYNGAVYDWTCGHLWVGGGYAGTGNTWRTRIAALNFGGEQPCDRVEVSAPNGGESWPIGATRTITWQASNPPDGSEFSVQYNWGGLWYELSPLLPSTARSLSWEVTGPETTAGKVFVGMWDGSNWGSYDYGDDFFTVFQPACTPAYALSCPWDLNSWISDGQGSTDVMDFYSCNTLDYSGNEYAYSFSTPTTSEVTVTLTGLGADLDLLILEGSSCYPDTCIADSTAGGTSDESVTFTAQAGLDYRIVVDGYAGASSTFTVELTCSEGSLFLDGFESGDTTAWDVTFP